MKFSPRRGDAACRWARPRLSLLAGDELVGDERRAVEQHVLGCPSCHAELASARSVLGLLRDVRQFDEAAGLDGPPPSVWPALQRRISEAKHAPRPRPLAGLGAWLDRLALAARPRNPALAAGLILALLLGAGAVALWTDQRADRANDAITQGRQPLPDDPSPRRLPLPPSPGPIAEKPPATPEDAVTARFDYDLDRGTPMGPDALDHRTGAY